MRQERKNLILLVVVIFSVAAYNTVYGAGLGGGFDRSASIRHNQQQAQRNSQNASNYGKKLQAQTDRINTRRNLDYIRLQNQGVSQQLQEQSDNRRRLYGR